MLNVIANVRLHKLMANNSSDNSSHRNDLDTEFYYETDKEKLALVIFIGALAIVGVFSNSLLLHVVMQEKKTKFPVPMFTKTLCVVDLTVCLIAMPYTMITTYVDITNVAACKFVRFLRMCSLNSSSFTIVTIAVERYFAVARPHQAFSFQTQRNLLITLLTVGVLISVPSLVAYNVYPILSQAGALVGYKCILSSIHPIGRSYKMVVVSFQGSIILTVSFIYAAIGRMILLRVYRKRKKNLVVPGAGTLQAPVPPVDQSQTATVSNTAANVGNIMPGVAPSIIKNDHVAVETPKSSSDPGSSSKYQHPTYTDNRGFHSVTTSPTSITILAAASSKISIPQKVALTFMVVTVVFILTWLPYWLEVFGLPLYKMTNHRVLHHFYFLNSAVNPLIYGLMNKQTRLHMKNRMPC